ncbi:MAG: DinB family protein [Myxococcota bacterium]
MTRYGFLVDTYATERVKVLSVWSQFADSDLSVRPHREDKRGRSVHEHFVHQCVSEDFWFKTMLGIDVGRSALPEVEDRMSFLEHYAGCSELREDALNIQPEAWFEESVNFFDTRRSRAWVLTRRIAHTAHHRGQQTTMLRQLGRVLHSTYGPTADTGGLMQDRAPTLYPYTDVDSLLEGERSGGRKSELPVPPGRPVTERP